CSSQKPRWPMDVLKSDPINLLSIRPSAIGVRIFRGALKTFRPWNPEQTLLLPPSPVEWLPEHHQVFFDGIIAQPS
ncbi:MAG: hypothetical protein ACO3B3_09110, partial [Cyanobium sp.]